ncbi:MAG: response regulator [Acidobacteriota bacterium]
MDRLRALVAEDDPETIELVSEIVDQFGADVTRAPTGQELLTRVCDDAPYDFIVADVAMPWLLAVQIVRVPVVVMTALREPKIADQVYALGEHATLLFKPFTFEELVSALQTCVRDVEDRRLDDLTAH